MQAVKRGCLIKWSYNGLSCTISPRATLTRMAFSHAAKLGGADQAVGGTGEGRTDQQNVGRLLMACTRMPMLCISRAVAAPMPPKPKIPQSPPASMRFRVN